MANTDILKVIPTLQSAVLVGENYRFFKKKKKKVRDYINISGNNIIGTNLIKSQAEFLGGI